VIDGAVDLSVKGDATQTIKPGSSWLVPTGTPHKGQIGGQGLKYEATYTVEKGKPLATPVPAPT